MPLATWFLVALRPPHLRVVVLEGLVDVFYAIVEFVEVVEGSRAVGQADRVQGHLAHVRILLCGKGGGCECGGEMW